ncbi:MAG: hypothetical protein GXP53_06660 [Deltaproteobacteria bacterium]|nr:hypothetical protein [Deltaproteobacteria bacterium]
MGFLKWFLQNFGMFFGGLFLVYIYMILRRLTVLYDFLRHVQAGEEQTRMPVGRDPALAFLSPFFDRLRTAKGGSPAVEAVIDAIWSEVDCRISVHFTAINGYINTLVLVGFAGTIFGSIGAFNEMFQGLAKGRAASRVFIDSWNLGLSTALYTSLGAAAIGGFAVTLLYSRFLMTRAKRLETMIGLRIVEVLEKGDTCQEENNEAVS